MKFSMTGQEKGDLLIQGLLNRGDHMVRFACIYLPGYLQVIGYNFKVKLSSLIINYVPSNIYSQKSPIRWFGLVYGV